LKIFLFLMLAAIGLGAHAAEVLDAHTGKVSEKSNDSLELDESMTIGFVTTTAARRSLRRIRVGDEVLAHFGSARRNGQLINKLVAIRLCVPKDAECAAARAKSRAENLAYEKRLAVSEKKFGDCMRAMEQTLAADTRYVPRNTTPASDDYRIKIKALAGEAKTCASSALGQHEVAFDDACEQHHCGDNVGGGCAHLARSAYHPWVFENVYAKCAQ
jgi:hypothetical protein